MSSTEGFAASAEAQALAPEVRSVGRRGPRLPRGRAGLGASLGLVPFFAYVTIFLLIPTIVVAVGAFKVDGQLSFGAFHALWGSILLKIMYRTIFLAAATAVIGAVVGALVAYVVATASPTGVLRRFVTSISGVLAQFGGVTLAFAFIATVGQSGIVTLWLYSISNHHINLGGSLWLFSLRGLVLVYTYFQIPLMVIVFMPAIDGVKPQWREAAENLGASTWQYWRHVGGPLLFPAFLGSTLLLFANAFSAYATAAALVTQGAPILPLQIRAALKSEVLLGYQNLGYAIALEMVVIVAIVMFLYTRLQRRTAGWLR
jgi:putative spermidine/putrescine transport system permease protein